jgi:hypothetical protein
VVNLERGDTVQVTMPKPYIKYKIISSSRSRDICYESVNGRTNGRTDGKGDYNIALYCNICHISEIRVDYKLI